MVDLLENSVEIHTPRRYEIKGKVHGNKIEKIGCLETAQHVGVIPYSFRRVTGFVAELAENRSIVFLPKKNNFGVGRPRCGCSPSVRIARGSE